MIRVIDFDIRAGWGFALPTQNFPTLLSADYLGGKNLLHGQGVRQGYGVVVSDRAKTWIDTEVIGVLLGSGRIERNLSTTVFQSNRLPCGANNDVQALLLQASPPAYQMVHAYGPRIRVNDVLGADVQLQLEEGIAVGVLSPNRALGLYV